MTTIGKIPEYRVHSNLSPLERWRHFAEMMAFAAAAVWTVYVFAYQQHIKPSSELPNVEFTPTVNHDYLRDGAELVHLDLSWKNNGSVPVVLAGYVVDVKANRYAAAPVNTIEVRQFKGLQQQEHSTVPIRTTTLLLAEANLFQPFTNNGRIGPILGPGDEFHLARSLVVPRGSYQTVTLRYGECAQRFDDHAITKVTTRRFPDGSFDPATLLQAKAARRSCSIGGYGMEFPL